MHCLGHTAERALDEEAWAVVSHGAITVNYNTLTNEYIALIEWDWWLSYNDEHSEVWFSIALFSNIAKNL